MNLHLIFIESSASALDFHRIQWICTGFSENIRRSAWSCIANLLIAMISHTIRVVHMWFTHDPLAIHMMHMWFTHDSPAIHMIHSRFTWFTCDSPSPAQPTATVRLQGRREIYVSGSETSRCIQTNMSGMAPLPTSVSLKDSADDAVSYLRHCVCC